MNDAVMINKFGSSYTPPQMIVWHEMRNLVTNFEVENVVFDEVVMHRIVENDTFLWFSWKQTAQNKEILESYFHTYVKGDSIMTRDYLAHQKMLEIEWEAAGENQAEAMASTP